MPPERSLESQDSIQTQLVRSEAAEWGSQFTKHFELHFTDLVSGLSDGVSEVDYGRMAVLSVMRVLGDSGADRESIRILLEEIVRSDDLARATGEVDVHASNVILSEHPWDSLRDQSKGIEDRSVALSICARNDEDLTAAFIVDELDRDGISAEWQDALVLCAESVQFREDTIRSRLWRRLLEIASRHRGKCLQRFHRPRRYFCQIDRALRLTPRARSSQTSSQIPGNPRQ